MIILHSTVKMIGSDKNIFSYFILIKLEFFIILFSLYIMNIN